MTNKKNYYIPESYEERIVKSLEAISKSLEAMSEIIVSDPGDEVESIKRDDSLPDDINNIP